MWAEFTAAVEDGSDGEGEEYLNDMTRDLFAEVLLALPEDDRTLISKAISDADDGYRKATIPDVDGVPGKNFRIDQDDGWWWRRIWIKAGHQVMRETLAKAED